jgi:glycerophosphoryl diester phosphodiesterase
VKLTLDEEVVVLHDQRLERTTDGEGPLSNFTLEEVKRLDAGTHFSPTFAGERIPRLADVLDTYGGEALFNIELTNYHSPLDPLPDKVVDLIDERGLANSVLLSSFNPIALLRVGSKEPGLLLGLLVRADQPGGLRWGLQHALSYQALHLETPLGTEETIAKARQSGLLVNIWTVNQPKEMRELVDRGATGMITDVPDVARQVLGDPSQIRI